MCKELLPVIEVDGATHFDADTVEKDKRKQKYLEEAGYTVLRFWDDEVLKNLDWVKETILAWTEKVEATKHITPFKVAKNVTPNPGLRPPPPAGDNVEPSPTVG